MMKHKWIFAAFALLVACAKEAPVPEPAEPPVHTIRAGFGESDPETRSRLSFDQSVAKVLWTAGDQFKMVKMNTSSYSSATYTTQDDGVEKATFTTNKTLSASDAYTSGYPAGVIRVGRRGEMGCYLIMPVPSEQHAVPGGLEEGLSRAAACSATQDADLVFHNLLSVIRFRLEGACVNTLASVTFDAGTTVAGDATVYFESGEPVIGFSVNWSSPTVERSTSVTLSGPFEEGREYCIAMVPATLQGFNMTFRDPDGNTLLKHSSKTLTLQRSRIKDFGTIRLGDSWQEEKPEVMEYIHQKKGSRKNIIAVLAEGYTESELDKFEMRAKSGIDFLFNTEPYKTYKDYFTVYLFRAVSNESGASVTDGNGTITQKVDTRFDARWGADSYSDMKADNTKIQDYLKAHCPEVVSGSLSYKDVPVILAINDTRYGGMCWSYSSGWAYCLVPYARNGGQSRWDFPKYQAVNPRDDSEGYRETTDEERDALGRHVGDWRSTLVHEFGGHGYGRLSDEYWNGTKSESSPGIISNHLWTVPLGLNVSGFYDLVPWNELLDNLDEWEAVHPDYGRVGIYQGAKTSLYYRWRSEPVSCMIDNRPYFNLWSRILIVRRIMEKAGETFDMEDFKAKDVAVDPVRPAAGTSVAKLRLMKRQAELVPEMPMDPPPVLVED